MTATRSTPRRRGARAETPITSDAIVDAAISLINDRGPHQFSMRALASELGVFPATLYWHVGDRAQLLGLIEHRWVSAVEIPEVTDWREWMFELAYRFRANAHRQPNVAWLVTVERARNTDALMIPDAIVGRLAALGLGDDVVHAFNALLGAVQGFVLLELSLLTAGPEPSDDGSDEVLRNLDPQQFPHITGHIDQLANRALSIKWSSGDAASLDDSFEFLLRVLIDGLAAQLQRRR
ncbi:MAG: Tetracycline repressor protein class from transposon [Actinomycetota bacterium]|jgi:TetR/AcrR family tetracycline transcriptional repressor